MKSKKIITKTKVIYNTKINLAFFSESNIISSFFTPILGQDKLLLDVVNIEIGFKFIQSSLILIIMLNSK